jgi:chloramphenicol-sensitive protein RarD
MNRGVLAAISAYFLWGVFPLYWKSMASVPTYEILCHRVIWSILFISILLSWRRQWNWMLLLKQNYRLLLPFILSAILIAGNWLTYIWAVNSGYIVETSLGYFINPLVNVFLGVIVLRERLRIIQWFSILIAFSGVLYLTIQYGQFPWISLILAFSFGFYGLIRKTSKLGSLEGLSLEMGILLTPAVITVIFLDAQGTSSFIQGTMITRILLTSTGIITTIPLLLFAYGARNVSLTTLGLLQYLAPTMQLLIGVHIYNEDFPQVRLVGFSLIWISFLIYSIEGIINSRNKFRDNRIEKNG